MLAWLWRCWGEVWPNLAADALTLAAGLVWHQRRLRRLLAEELRRHRPHLGDHPGRG